MKNIHIWFTKNTKLVGLLLLLLVAASTPFLFLDSDRSISEAVRSVATTSIQNLTAITEGPAEGTDDITDTEQRAEAGAEATEKSTIPDSGQRRIATFAGGCFWCTEAYLQETFGVTAAISGFAGGAAETATYKQVVKGSTSHREAVQVTYDPARVTYEELLDVYWSHIDPTDDGGQFADRGTHYTTAIYYHNEAERVAAEASKVALQASGLFTKPIVTRILPYSTFFPAEEYHQDYYKKASAHYERYKKASGRAGFIEDNWAKEAALQFLETKEGGTSESTSSPTASPSAYVPRDWSAAEIATAVAKLPADVYRIVAKDGTEPAFKNKYWDNKEAGIYVDVVTGEPLFSSTHQFDSGTGWPSFYQPINDNNITLKQDRKLFITRTEVRSASGHLGHVFDDGPEDKGGKRYCLNSLALKFVPKSDMATEGYGEYLYLF